MEDGFEGGYGPEDLEPSERGLEVVETMMFDVGGGQLVAAASLLILAVAHSVLGERAILQPLFGGDAGQPRAGDEMPLWARNRILQFAWHLTSMAWIAMAAIALGADAFVAIGVLCLASSIVIFVALRGHLAWPIFLVGGVAAFAAADAVDPTVAQAAGWTAVAALLGASALHLYWVAGGEWLTDCVVPANGDGKVIFPPRWATLAVAVALAAFSVLLIVVLVEPASLTSQIGLVRVLVGLGAAVFAARAVGDGRYAGFSKKVRTTDFGRADDAYFTPVVTFIAIGAAVGLVLA